MASNPFLGRFQHSLDDKGRVILPAKWRSHLEGGAVVAEWMDGCLAVFPLAEFDRVADEVSAKAKRGDNERLAMRSFFSGANDVVPDKQGRIALAQSSREYAHLGAEVVLSGVGKRIEIWNVELFEGKEGEGKAVLHSADGIADFV